MTFEEFQSATLGELASMTGVDRHRWSRYLSGKVALTDTTLLKIAEKLEMSPVQLLEAILRRRRNAQAVAKK